MESPHSRPLAVHSTATGPSHAFPWAPGPQRTQSHFRAWVLDAQHRVPQLGHVQLTPMEFNELELMYHHQAIKPQNVNVGRSLRDHPAQPPIKALLVPSCSGLLSLQVGCSANAGISPLHPSLSK